MNKWLAAVTAWVLLPSMTFGAAPREAASIGIVADPCPARQVDAAAAAARMAAVLEPGAKPLVLDAARREAIQRANADRLANDWPQLCRYAAENREMLPPAGEARIVFLGDSITEFWVAGDPELFSGGVIGRGIAGQTTAQMLVRFRDYVVALRPAAIHLMAGTNDIAGNGGPTTLDAVQGNVQSIVELAEQNGIAVVLASIPPAADFPWRPGQAPAQTIVRMNAWLAGYAAGKGLCFIDYHSALADEGAGLDKTLSNDGVHPNRLGYAKMHPLAIAAVEAIRASAGAGRIACP